MHILFAALLAFQSATVIDVQANATTTVRLQLAGAIYTVEFPRNALAPDDFAEGDEVQEEIKQGKMTVKRKDGKRVSGRVTQIQRILIHPLEDKLNDEERTSHSRNKYGCINRERPKLLG